MIIRKKRYWAIWLAVFYAYFWLHELAGHYLTNIVSGMKMSQMYIDGLKIYNVVILPLKVTYTEIEPPRISAFMGGAVAAFVLISLSIIFILFYRKKKKERYFVLFSITLGIGCMGLIEVIVEPLFPTYHRSLTNALILLAVSISVPIIINLIHYHKYKKELIW